MEVGRDRIQGGQVETTDVSWVYARVRSRLQGGGRGWGGG